MLRNLSEDFEIFDSYERTLPYLDNVREAADANRDSLGFFAASVYQEFARGGFLYVLAKKQSNQFSYAGHLLFSCSFPRAHVRQIFTLPAYRRRNMAENLLRHLRDSLTQLGFISIYARVAEDLPDANAFWERNGFCIQRVERGGTTRNRSILVRCHELPSPQLFPSSGITNVNPLGPPPLASSDVPLFLVDLNVLFDVLPRRLRRNEAASLFQAERMNSCRLAISSEIAEELKRTAYAGKTDPMEAYISLFPTFPLADGVHISALLGELATLVFPGRTLSDAAKSDLRHIATSIENNLAGFITNDSEILAASSEIQTRYGLQVISTAAFEVAGASVAEDNASFDVSDSMLQLSAVSSADEPKVRALLLKLRLSGSAIATSWLSTEKQGRAMARMAVWKEDVPLGYLAWTARVPGSHITIVRVAVDEAEPDASSAGRILIMNLLEELASSGPQRVTLELPPNQFSVRELTAGFGFRAAPGQAELTKVILGRVMTPDTWATYREELISGSGLKLPLSIPQYRSTDQQIQVLRPDGNQAHVSLDSLETLLAPALLCLPDRPAVITPVQRRFSETLLGHSTQGSLLARAAVSTYHERHYLSHPRNLHYFKRGTLIFFYESTKQGGRGELIAVARVRQAYLKPSTNLAADLEQSVLTEASLSEIGTSDIKTVTVFDNIFHIKKGVPLAFLQRIGCGRPNDLISTRSISDTQFQEILREAFHHE